MPESLGVPPFVRLVEADDSPDVAAASPRATSTAQPAGSTAQPAGRTSVRVSVFNIVNVFVSLGLLSKPFALASGGWASLVILALLCVLSNVTGKLIVLCFAVVDGPRTYPELGRVAAGEKGRWLVTIVVTAELCVRLRRPHRARPAHAARVRAAPTLVAPPLAALARRW